MYKIKSDFVYKDEMNELLKHVPIMLTFMKDISLLMNRIKNITNNKNLDDIMTLKYKNRMKEYIDKSIDTFKKYDEVLKLLLGEIKDCDNNVNEDNEDQMNTIFYIIEGIITSVWGIVSAFESRYVLKLIDRKAKEILKNDVEKTPLIVRMIFYLTFIITLSDGISAQNPIIVGFSFIFPAFDIYNAMKENKNELGTEPSFDWAACDPTQLKRIMDQKKILINKAIMLLESNDANTQLKMMGSIANDQNRINKESVKLFKHDNNTIKSIMNSAKNSILKLKNKIKNII